MTFRDTVVATIAYADVFDYPLTEEEVGKWVINSKFKIQNSKLKRITGVEQSNGYFFLKGRRRIVALRKQREKWANEKMRAATRAVKILKFIPTIKLIGVTGALAMKNAHKEDDIDFYIVSTNGTLWATRLLATLILFHLRRKPGDTKFRNKICLNMYVDENHLAVPKQERDLFAAHEVLQMKPLWEKNGTYGKFLKANKWVRNFLLKAWSFKSQITNHNVQIKEKFPFIFLLVIEIWSLRFVETLVRSTQLWYMRNRRSTEVVSDSLIRFHPSDARVWVKSRFATILARYNIPLDKVFYAR